MAKTIVIPDIHGRSFWKKENELKCDDIVFLGDYSDPYSEEWISHEEAIENLKEIIEFAKNNKNKVHLLLGNHDLHYIDWKIFPPCSRFSHKHKDQYNKIYRDNIDLFNVCYKNDRSIFTHAGITNNWLLRHNITCNDDSISDDINKLLKNNPSAFYQVPYSRGGDYITGSPIWADMIEFNDNSIPELNLVQVVGHSKVRHPLTLDNKIVFCDCKRTFELNISDQYVYIDEHDTTT